MKQLAFLLVLTFSASALANDVITCGDAESVGVEAKLALHKEAQQRAQKAIEEFVEKPVVTPYVGAFGAVGDAKSMAAIIEIYWCESAKTPLHAAYYRFYSSNKSVFGASK